MRLSMSKTKSWIERAILSIAALTLLAGLNVCAATSSTLDSNKWNEVKPGVTDGKPAISLKKATKDQYDAYTGTKTVVSTSDSEVETVAWAEGDTSSVDMYWYSAADTVYTPENIGPIFQNFADLNVNDFNTSRTTDMSYMFAGCTFESIDLSGLDTRSATNMSYMFVGVTKVTHLDLSGFDTSNVTNMEGMFYQTSEVKSIDLTGWDTSNVTTMLLMFNGCYALENIDVSMFDTKNVTNMGNMFSNCGSLKTLDVSNFDTSNATNLTSFFSYDSYHNKCSLTYINVSGFDLRKCRNISRYPGLIYASGHSLKTIIARDIKLPENATDFPLNFTFAKGSLETVDLSGSDLPLLASTFAGCSKLKTVDLTGTDTSNLTTTNKAFSGCSSLKNIYIDDSWTTDAVTNSDGMFADCTSLPHFTENGQITDKTYAYAGLDRATGKYGYLTKKSSNTTTIYNEPYHDFSFYKKSSYDQSLLDGAVFHLTGTSVEGTRVDKYAVSGAARGKVPSWVASISDSATKAKITEIFGKPEWDKDDAAAVASAIQAAMKDGTYGNTTVDDLDGTVKFDRLERGTYVLTEVTAPTIYWYDKDTKTYKTDKYNINTNKFVVQIGMTTNSSGKVTYTSSISGLTVKDGGIPVMYDTAVKDKTITIKKIWNDGITNHDPSELAITITTKVPEAIASRYNITFDANGGSFGSSATNKVVYNKNGVAIQGTYADAAKDEYEFTGWNTKADGTGIAFESSEFDGQILGETKEKLSKGADGNTLYAIYAQDTGAKYAVSIYGINVDTLEDGSTGGLTFGPATGYYDYVTGTGDADGAISDGSNKQGYVAHIAKTDQPAKTNYTSKRCIHWDDWETIIAINKENPTVYSDCIAKGCTKSVPLSVDGTNNGDQGAFVASGYGDTRGEPDASYGSGYSTLVKETGDGAGMLRNEITGTAKIWAAYNNQTNKTSMNSYDNLTWKNSNIRAALNGSDTSISYNPYDLGWTENTCILSAFPKELRDAIGKKKVAYSTVYSATEDSIGYTYDKLWLFSVNELSGRLDNTNKDEGSIYAKFSPLGGNTNSSTPLRTARYAATAGSGTRYWWVRSRDARDSYSSHCVDYSGRLGNFSSSACYGNSGVAPGFTLSRK